MTHQHRITKPTLPRRIGAAASVAAVVATAFTATATTAVAAPRADGDQVVGPLVTETSSFQGAASFSAPSAGALGQELPTNRAATLAGARDRAVAWFLPAAGSTASVRPVSSPDLCLTAASATAGIASRVTLQRCTEDDPAQQFTQAANTGSNNPIGTGLRSAFNGGFLGLYNNDPVMRLQVKEIGDRIPTIGDFLPAFSARVDGVSAATRTATLSGRGTPGARVVVNETAAVTIRADGTWTASVPGLVFGANTIRLEQYEGSTQTGAATLTAVLDAAPLTFTAAFVAALATPVQASGVAQPGASVQVFDQDGSPVSPVVTANATTGAWATTISAPDAGGDHDVTAAQFLAGLRDPDHDVTRTLDYGDAVRVDQPADGAAHAGGPLAMTGVGEPGSVIEVHEITGGTDRLVGRSTEGVLPNGRWTVATDALDRAEHVLRVVQRSRGANATTAELTINPGETGRLAPVTVTSPTTVTPGLTNRFQGTAEPGATYRVLNVSGTQIVPGTLQVDADGTWEFERVVSAGARSFQFRIEQTKDDQTETSELFSFDANQGLAPIVVSTEAVIPGFTNTFEGTGPAGATFEVLNASGNTIVPGTHRIDEDGTWSFERAVSAGVLDFSFKLRVTVDGATYTTKLYELPAATR